MAGFLIAAAQSRSGRRRPCASHLGTSLCTLQEFPCFILVPRDRAYWIRERLFQAVDEILTGPLTVLVRSASKATSQVSR
jgi:hypothetical protein